MNQDKDDILALRVENDPPIKVEVKRVVPTPRMVSPGLEQAMRTQQAAAQRAMTPLEQLGYGGGIAAQQAQQPFGLGYRPFGGLFG